MNAKYLQFGILLILCVFADQWSKHIATTRLAATHSSVDHPMLVSVTPEQDGLTVEQVLTGEFSRNEVVEVGEIARRYAFNTEGRRLRPEAKVSVGDTIKVTRRKLTVIPGYFDFEYTRNPGAAFGFLSDGDSPLRIPFFIVVSLIAIGVIVMMLRGVDRSDQLSIWALALVAGGAIGNFIDRVANGWVIDFIVWKYTEEYRWPTFNVADAFISVGVTLLIVQMGREWFAERTSSTDPSLVPSED